MPTTPAKKTAAARPAKKPHVPTPAQTPAPADQPAAKTGRQVLAERFTPLPSGATDVDAPVAAVAKALHLAAKALDRHAPAGRELSIAHTHLQEAFLVAQHAIHTEASS